MFFENLSTQTRHRNEKLEAEAKTSAEKFKEITGKWQSVRVREVPHMLHKLVVEQQKMCQMVVEEKNKIIKQIQIVSVLIILSVSLTGWLFVFFLFKYFQLKDMLFLSIKINEGYFKKIEVNVITKYFSHNICNLFKFVHILVCKLIEMVLC